MNKKIVIILIMVGLGSFAWYQEQVKVAAPITEVGTIQVVATKPNPLDEATILPNEEIEITFNNPIYISELKHRFDPEVEHEVVVVNGIDKEMGYTFKIIFKNPLELGAGYTLFILSNTHDQAGHIIDREYIYHFKTIGYRGV